MGTAGLSDADLARRAADGDGAAFAELFDRWFDRVYDVAWHVVHNRDTAADVAQDTFVAAWRSIGGLRTPESFGGWLLRIGRNRALNRLRRDRRSVPVGDDESMERLDPRPAPDGELADVVGDRERDDLVWVASVALGADDASLLSLHLRHGLEANELADELGVQPNAVHQRLHRLKRRLGDAIGAWVLWARGAPACPHLRDELAAARQIGFDASTASVIRTHSRSCEQCQSDRDGILAPEALFAATPLLLAPAQLREQVTASLRDLDVPVDQTGSSSDLPRWRPSRVAVMTAAAVVVAVLAGGAVALSRGGDDTPALSVAEEQDLPVAAGSDSAPPSTAPVETTTPPTTALAPTTTEETAPPSTTTTTSTTVPPPEPVVDSFTATEVQGNCSGYQQVPVVFAWSSRDADAATLGPVGGAAQPVEPNGTRSLCAFQGSTWVLTLTGPAGTTTADATVP